MKNIILAFVAGLIPALALTTQSYAQSSSDMMASKEPVNNYFKLVKTDASKSPNTATLEMVNAKALKNFRKQYKVNDEKWTQGIDCITATYEVDSISRTIYFDKRGNWFASLKLYSEDKMPKDIRRMVKQQYYDYKIICTREIETYENAGSPVYLVTIEDKNNIKQVRIQGDEMGIYTDSKKS